MDYELKQIHDIDHLELLYFFVFLNYDREFEFQKIISIQTMEELIVHY
jgi:hypothetical protein